MEAAQMGVADDVPPNVVQPVPPNDVLKTVMLPVSSLALAETSGSSRQAELVAPTGDSVRQNW
jgi:hypothetical protein